MLKLYMTANINKDVSVIIIKSIVNSHATMIMIIGNNDQGDII